jgi:hypothetical protein
MLVQYHQYKSLPHSPMFQNGQTDANEMPFNPT